MSGVQDDENLIRTYLELPSSELGLYDDESFSDDHDSDADPIYIPSYSDIESDNDRVGIINNDEVRELTQNTTNSPTEHQLEVVDLNLPGPSTVSNNEVNGRKRKRRVRERLPNTNNKNKKEPKYPHVWNKSDFSPTIFVFDETNSGVVDDSNELNEFTELKCFEKLLPDDLLDLIVLETNKHFNFIVNNCPPSEKSRLKQWSPITKKELKLFFAVVMLMTHSKKVRIEDYWSNDPLHKNSIPELMSRDRFLNILRLLHFSDNTQPGVHGKLTKIKPVLDIFRKTFSSSFIPFRNLCVDESLMLFKGRLGFRQYIPSKRSRFGIKLYILCDCDTGYVLDVIVYTGKETEITNSEDLGISGSIITTFLKDYLNKGHCLYIDNWYTSPDLLKFLHDNQTNACGTVKSNRVGMPKYTQQLKAGDTEIQNDGTMVALRWQDKREVRMLTTEHKIEMVRTGKINFQTKEHIMKPNCINDYNLHMGSVDRSDMMIVHVECIRRSTRWYKKLFFHLLDIAILNSHAIFLCKTGKKPTLQSFHFELIRQLIENNMEPRISRQRGGRPSIGENPTRLTQRHFPALVPSTEKKKNVTRVCHVCKHTKRREQKRRESRYMCNECDVALCVVPCFAEYHELKHF